VRLQPFPNNLPISHAASQFRYLCDKRPLLSIDHPYRAKFLLDIQKCDIWITQIQLRLQKYDPTKTIIRQTKVLALEAEILFYEEQLQEIIQSKNVLALAFRKESHPIALDRSYPESSLDHEASLLYTKVPVLGHYLEYIL